VSGFWTSSAVLDAIFGIDGSYVRSIQGWVELIHPEDRGMMELYLQANVIAAHQPFAKQYRIIRPSDGEVRWVQGLGEGSFNDDGVFLALVGTIHDITDLKQAEQSLIDTNQRMHLATDSAGQGIWDWDLLAGTMTWDDRMFALYGASREEIQGTVQDWKDGLHPEDLERAIAECEAALRGEAPFNTEFRVRHRDGSILWIKALAQVLRDSSGVPVRMIGINQDITEQKKVEAQLQRAQKMESLGNLASGIAHDMNNVLGAILGLSSAELINFTPNQPIYRTLNIIREAATRGGGVVRSLLTLARPSPKERRVVNLNELLLEEARLLERTTLSKVRLELDLIPDLQPILGDAAELSHVIMNLCINAVDAMGERGTLTLRTRNVSEAHVEVTVEDSGCGMPTDVLAKAMDPFFTTKEAGKGTGLGLAMVFATVKAHGGEVTLRSEVGQGTMVSLRFPTIATKDLVAEPPVSNQSCVGTATLAVLLVDDDDLMQASTRMLLEALGHAVTSASSGEEALSLLDQGLRPEAVILDMNMPGLGGKGTLPRLRDSCPTVPVFLATGRADDEAMDLAAAHPFVTLLPKPFGFEELQGHLQQISPQA
jgi:PAS domain S-box-containing protein